MSTVKFPAVAVLAVSISGCGPDPVPEASDIEPATISDSVVTDATRRASLQDMVGGSITGELLITPLQDSAVFRVEVSGAAPETTYGVRVQPGSCENPGEPAVILEGVRTGALGNGTSQRSLSDDWQQLLDGQHVVAIYASAAVPGTDRPVACAQIPSS